MALRFASLALLVAYVIAAVLWSLALFGGRLTATLGGEGAGLLFVVRFGAAHVLLTALFAAAVVATAAHLLRSRGAARALPVCVFSAGVVSAALSAWYAHFFFYG